MKQLIYLLILLVLVQSCAQNENRKPYESQKNVPTTAPKEVLDTAAAKETDFSKVKANKKQNATEKKNKLAKETEMVSPVSEAREDKASSEEIVTTTKEVAAPVASKKKRVIEPYKTRKIPVSPAIHEVFVESGMQKIQQLFDLAVLLNDTNTTEDMKTYALSNSSRYYLKPKNTMKTSLLKLNKEQADSIVVSSMKLKQLNALKALNTYKGTYKLKINYFKAEKQIKQKQKTATLLLEIVPLNVDGKIYNTIESKVLELK